jgi:hypothetical protein
MFSREESRKLRAEFWTAFGKSYPRKWMLYKTGQKELAFKFHFDLKKAMVIMDVEGSLESRISIWEKLISLKSILQDEYLPEAIFEDYYLLENQKEISRIYVQKTNVSIHDKSTWQEAMEFLSSKMSKFEAFFIEFEDIIE